MSTSTAEQTLPSEAQRWTIIGTLFMGAFVFSLNARGSILESPLIIQAFGLDRYKIQWVTGLEGVAGLTSLFSSVYLAKVFGARRVFLLGAACLAVGALGEALARTPLELGVAVVVRSCGGFLPIPGLITFQRLMPGRIRFAYCTWLTLVYGGQVIVEPIGALVAFHPSWRALFVAIGACGVVLVLFALCLFPDDRPRQQPEHGFDFAGAGLFIVIFALVLFLLYRGNYLGWRVSTPIWCAAAGLVAALALFTWRQLVAPEPFLHLGGFATRTVALTMLASAFWCASLYGVAIHRPDGLLLLGYEHWKTGWVMLPMVLILLAVMLLGAFVARRDVSVWLFRAGLAGMTVVGLWQARIDIYTPWQWVVGVSSLWAAFAGMCMSPIAQLTFEGQPPALAGATGAMKFFMRSFNGTVGILMVGVVIEQGSWWGLDFVRDAIVQGQGAVQADVPGIRDHLVRHGSTPAEAVAQGEAVLGYWVNLHAQVIGYRTGLRFCAYLSAAGLVVSCFISRRKEPSVFDAG
ncbi:MAG: MFS transporter [Solirubrobacterales bacterium]|nr:MFS transporter [Solirubrobacterales bacterium]